MRERYEGKRKKGREEGKKGREEGVENCRDEHRKEEKRRGVTHSFLSLPPTFTPYPCVGVCLCMCVIV